MADKKEKLTHYRKVFKSDHLGVADLEEFIEEKKSLVFTIEKVEQYRLKDGDKNSGVVVAGRRISANIAYFKDKTVKPMVLNAGNSLIVRKFANGDPFVERWKNILIEIYVDSDVKMKGETVGGLKIRKTQPQKERPVLSPDSENWEAAKTAVKEQGATMESISKHYIISPANFDLLCG